ncbi:hypothetical protein O181_019784 [Austropuccinia psidii MF-1]|uniref:Uncharacterized protein n=1 Tax=Austropuccinia psidii MF-1 TaxID=1389203 RepID=A0A9Q3GV30_9BASI|nr:hypothetical protein [Austropuccinia psidii MF-1]
MAHVQRHASIRLSCFLALLRTQILALFQDPDTSHANPYTCPGSRLCTHKSLCLYRFAKSKATPSAGAGSQQFQQLLMPVKAPKASHPNIEACTGSRQFKQFLMPVQAFGTSHANPYACEGSQQFRQFLMPAEAFNASHANPYACTGSQQFRQFLTLGQPLDNSKNSVNS